MFYYNSFFLQDEVEVFVFKNTVAYDLLMVTGTGVLSGIIAAAIFFLILRIFKPKIVISDKIVKQLRTNRKDGETEYVYKFKFINMSKSDIENVSIDFFLMEDFFNGSAKNFKTKSLQLAQPEFKFLVGLNNKNHDIHNNCVQMSIREPLEELWDGQKEWLQVQIDSTHSKSGRRRVHIKNYKDPKNTISIGKFDSGDNFTIIP